MASSSGTYKEGINKQGHGSAASYNGNSVHGEWGVPTFQHQQTISMDWTPEEQAMLEEGLSKWVSFWFLIWWFLDFSRKVCFFLNISFFCWFFSVLFLVDVIIWFPLLIQTLIDSVVFLDFDSHGVVRFVWRDQKDNITCSLLCFPEEIFV